jgi:hypothetical protein
MSIVMPEIKPQTDDLLSILLYCNIVLRVGELGAHSYRLGLSVIREKTES